MIAFKRRAAFTLVELLVVIGIIAILISVLLPTLAGARKAGNAVKCSAAMRQIGDAFKLYSIDNKGKYPVVKWYIRPASAQPTINGQTLTALYWQDFLQKYVAKSTGQGLNSAGLGAGNASNFALARTSIFWGCPEWQGRYGGTTTSAGVSPYENGYSYNWWFGYDATTPIGQHPPYSKTAIDDPAENLIVGEWPLFKRYNPSAERCLVMESTLWLLWLVGTDASHYIWPQISYNTGYAIGWTTPGWHSIDMYRHGKYPPIRADGYFTPGKGRVSFNILYADGHVSTVNSINDGFRAVQMRDP